MGIIEIIIIAIVEAMDCFAVSIATGLSKKGIKYSRAIIQAVSFGVFQGGMTLLGYFLGSFAERWFSSVATPIACTILCVLGLRMIWGAIRGDGAHEYLLIIRQTGEYVNKTKRIRNNFFMIYSCAAGFRKTRRQVTTPIMALAAAMMA